MGGRRGAQRGTDAGESRKSRRSGKGEKPGKRKRRRDSKGKAGRGRGSPGATLAQRADRHDLYQQSVQEPSADVSFVRRVFKKRYDRPPRLLREDFCGTALLCCEWARRHPENRAWGVDLDPETLDWGRRHNLSRLKEGQRKRIELVEGDVLEVEALEKVDLVVAMNFSYFVFQDRATLLSYFRRARSHLGDEGLLILDAYGGADAQRTLSESREQEGFEYVWDQHLFDPIHNRAVNYIHFEFPDGSRIRRAFHYDWRLWSLPELRDALLEAGFSRVDTYWEGTDHETGEGNGVYRRATRAPDDPAWVAYLAASL